MRNRPDDPIDLVGGSRAHFTELNRGIEGLPSDLPALTYSLTPQMHARELDHILDSLSMHGPVAQNALRLAAGRPVRVGPITMARRFNAVATSGSPGPEVEALRAVDPLLDTDLAAAWTLGSLAALSVAGIAGVCYFETAGPRGVSGTDGLRPVGRVLDRFAGRRGWPVLATHCSPRLAALAVRRPDGAVRLSLADLSGRGRSVRIAGADGNLRIEREVELAPWEVLELDL